MEKTFKEFAIKCSLNPALAEKYLKNIMMDYYEHSPWRTIAPSSGYSVIMVYPMIPEPPFRSSVAAAIGRLIRKGVLRPTDAPEVHCDEYEELYSYYVGDRVDEESKPGFPGGKFIKTLF